MAKYSAECIIAEIGTDMGQFPSEKHLSSWAGMAPGNNESGGKKKLQRQLMETNIYVPALWNAAGEPAEQRIHI